MEQEARLEKSAWISTLMRVVLGIIFLVHGYMKFQMGLGNVDAWFTSAGTPGFLAYIAGPLELVGGVMLIIGLFTRYVSILFVLLMVAAIVLMKLPLGLVSDTGAGYELDLGFLLIALHLTFAKSTPLSLDKAFLSE
ncbi:DoxX family protein [Paenibacillus sp. y28]|uniref:DoxX family protein n=1 Tax=Paenibacillus sp. y28 TaxID=3129110 RepID=UPI0030180CC3